MTQTKNVVSWQSFMSLHLKLLDIDHPLTFEESKLRQIEAHALIYLSEHVAILQKTMNFYSTCKTDVSRSKYLDLIKNEKHRQAVAKITIK